MATEKQIEANRRNALRSTGPRTPEGKAVVRLNSLRHGLRADTIVLPGENIEEFEQLRAAMEAEWQPRTPTQRELVEDLAVARWKLRRMEVGEASIYTQEAPASAQLALLDKFSQYQARLKRLFFKTIRELEHLQARQPDRPAESVPPPHIPAALPAPEAEGRPATARLSPAEAASICSGTPPAHDPLAA
jgi:hypothetical protein